MDPKSPCLYEVWHSALGAETHHQSSIGFHHHCTTQITWNLQVMSWGTILKECTICSHDSLTEMAHILWEPFLRFFLPSAVWSHPLDAGFRSQPQPPCYPLGHREKLWRHLRALCGQVGVLLALMFHFFQLVLHHWAEAHGMSKSSVLPSCNL